MSQDKVNLQLLETQIASLDSSDRTQLLGRLIRYVIIHGEVEASSIRNQLRIIEEGRG